MNIFMTGGAGFLGRAIMRHFRDEVIDAQFTIFSRDEAKHAVCRREFPEARYILGDVTNYDQVELAMTGHDTVIHAAAMKYVPEGETNVLNCIAVNLDGSRNVGIAAIRNRIDRVVAISTDKACEPANVYGMTKRLMERVFQEMAQDTDTAFVTVRYGNVIGSTGSVIPMFRQQARDGIITLTDSTMTRFWLTVDKAVDLIWGALNLLDGYSLMSGTIIIPQLLSARMIDLVEAIDEVEGTQDTSHIKEIGQRPGEKTDEILLSASEALHAQWIGDAFVIQPNWRPLDDQSIHRYKVSQYTSDNPVSFLEIADLVKMIQSAPEG